MTPNQIDMRAKLMSRLGIQVDQCTADEWLDLALSAAATCAEVGPLDPAFLHFREREQLFLNAAALRELIDVAANK